MKRLLGTFVAAAIAIGCSGGGVSGNPGTAGSGGGGGGGSGGGNFIGVLPCLTEASYATTGTTIQFGVAGNVYQPACLKVAAGTTVTFTGDFVVHPLQPSAKRGTLTGNPITASNGSALPDGGMSEAFVFPTPGFYAYFCDEHSIDDGTLMDGVVWVQ